VTAAAIRARGAGRRDLPLDELVALAVGVAAALTFPLLVVVVHGRRDRRRNRRMGSRRTDKIRLTGED
jgi:hypothetical protein